MAVRRTGYTETTPQHYLLDAGAIYRNLTFTDGEWGGELLGATSGGNTLTIENTYRTVEVDGVKVATRGGRALETAMATLEANVKEITAENYRRSINGRLRPAEADEAPEGYVVVEGKMNVDDEDYDDNVAYVGTLSGSDQPVIAILENAFVTSAATIEAADNTEATLPMTFEASADHDDIENERLPWKIFFPPVATDGTPAGATE